MTPDHTTLTEILDALPAPRIGHNNPPLTPYEVVERKINDLYGESKLWLDGATVDSQQLADGLANLMAMLRQAATEADEARIAEKKPLDEKIKEIQDRYNALTGDTKSVKGKTTLAIAACRKALQPWLDKLDAEIREKARLAREEADRQTRAAQEAIRAAEATNLAEREAAEQLIRDAKKAETIANKAEKQTATAGGAFGRSASLRTSWVARVDDPIAFGRYAWVNHRDEYETFLQGLADRLVRLGKREITGVNISEIREAV